MRKPSATEAGNEAAVTGKTSSGGRSNRQKNGILIIMLVSLAMINITPREPVETVDCTPEIMASKPDIVMLGAWWCSYCYQAKKYFQNNDIHYCEYDMENTETGRRLYQDNGGGAIPVLLIGEHRIKGYSEQRIEQALSLLKNHTSTLKKQ